MSINTFQINMETIWRQILHFAVLSVLLMGLSCSNPLERRWNQKEAAVNVRTLRDAEKAFHGTKDVGKFGTMKDLANAGLIDAPLASGTKNGYRFNIRLKDNSFEAVATPVEFGVTGGLSFYVNESGVIRAGDKKGAEADIHDDPLEKQ